MNEQLRTYPGVGAPSLPRISAHPFTRSVFAHALVEIPERTTADYELTKLQRQLGDRLVSHKIRKVRPGPKGKYTLRYLLRDTETVKLF